MAIESAGRRRLVLAVLASLAVALVVALGMPLIGSSSVSLAKAWQGISPDREILFDFRLPRVLMALLAGGALAAAGVVSQALLRDALATPYTLGVSSGASLGAVLAIVSQFPAVWAASLVGAGVAMFVVIGLATEGRRVSSFTLLLAGVTINSICLALVLFLQSLSTLGQSIAITRWLMGGIDGAPYAHLLALAVAVIVIVLVLLGQARAWNLMAVGEEWAAARGVETARLQWIGYLSISALTGLVTAFTGPIGFVGLIVPHALRLSLGADHRLILPCSFLLGAAFLAVCDTMARVVLAPAEVPVGVITALLGGPFFIWLLRSRRRSLWL
jgi:iron complex transport system permease protein